MLTIQRLEHTFNTEKQNTKDKEYLQKNKMAFTLMFVCEGKKKNRTPKQRQPTGTRDLSAFCRRVEHIVQQLLGFPT